ncbi:hypothetical protein FQN54_007112 [Arachnomyces sp. PD_36]|nr:hypothetical protein FQN54_007112 [Arachnomyces sp. PD_36]
MTLSAEARATYTKIIDGILAASDLNTISEKRIRRGLQEALGYDITPQKAFIKDLILERFDLFAQPDEVDTSQAPEPSPSTNGHAVKRDQSGPSATPISPTKLPSPQKREADQDELLDVVDKSPPKKKRKADSAVDADAAYAAKLQAEENLRARPTRGGSTRKAAPAKKKKSAPKSKTSKKVKAEDDSDLDGSEASGKKEVNRTGGFHKPMNLSPSLSALLDGETAVGPRLTLELMGSRINKQQLSRPQTVKRVWQYIRENSLQDPSDRRQILCDDPMRAVFKQDRIHMFTMTKILNQNLYNPDE